MGTAMTSKPQARSYIAAIGAFASGADTPRAFLERCLESISEREKDVLAFVHIEPEKARAIADAATLRWKAGGQLSPIDGMPIGVKDVIETEDMPTGMGSPLFTGVRSGRDSASVKALRQAGAIILGKTVTTEFASSFPGPTRNPWDLARTPGGSSSGSAAGAACGFFSVGLGTQVLGSILRPSSFCGVVGFKPSFGAINRGGSHDFMSQSAQGALGASCADVWRVLREISERAGGDAGYPGLLGTMELPATRQPKALVFFETPGWAKTSETLKAEMRDTLAKLEKAGVEIISRNNSHEVEYLEQAFEICMRVTREINGWESLWPMNIYRDRDASKLSAPMLARSAEAEKMKPADYHRALAERATLRAAYAKLAARADACITLSATGPAPVGLASTGDAAFAVHASVLGVPAISLPLLSEAGLPVGLQLMGFDWRDADLFAVAGAVETLVGAGAA
jgi:Asp-tRNA(Asn)/Glu-tRNA(Gln) amidotransferase A subunit family amidase